MQMQHDPHSPVIFLSVFYVCFLNVCSWECSWVAAYADCPADLLLLLNKKDKCTRRFGGKENNIEGKYSAPFGFLVN